MEEGREEARQGKASSARPSRLTSPPGAPGYIGRGKSDLGSVMNQVGQEGPQPPRAWPTDPPLIRAPRGLPRDLPPVWLTLHRRFFRGRQKMESSKGRQPPGDDGEARLSVVSQVSR